MHSAHPELSVGRWTRRAITHRVIGGLTRDVIYRKQTELSRRYAEQFRPDLRCSQAGEDGIIREIVRRLQLSDGWFVELGAGDGVLFSNTYALRRNGWRGVGIESDPDRFVALQQIAACERELRDDVPACFGGGQGLS
ncbi:MAG: hypothetical protein QF681_00080 [Vicinamibacterales bacterium]|jgi:hypothetical protein|nr:hypothetical protein [Vicinamibacterales bacterium]